jgi:hypothetical protein
MICKRKMHYIYGILFLLLVCFHFLTRDPLEGRILPITLSHTTKSKIDSQKERDKFLSSSQTLVLDEFDLSIETNMVATWHKTTSCIDIEFQLRAFRENGVIRSSERTSRLLVNNKADGIISLRLHDSTTFSPNKELYFTLPNHREDLIKIVFLLKNFEITEPNMLSFIEEIRIERNIKENKHSSE